MHTVSTVFLGMRLEVEADYQPSDPGGPYEPPTPEGMDVGEIYGPDGITPCALSDRQVDDLEEQLLREYHAEADYNAFADRS